jgi:hypothetical protein
VVTPSTIVVVKSIRSTILIAQEVAATRKSGKGGGRGAMTRCPYHHHASYSSSSFNVSSSSLTAKSDVRSERKLLLQIE